MKKVDVDEFCANIIPRLLQLLLMNEEAERRRLLQALDEQRKLKFQWITSLFVAVLAAIRSSSLCWRSVFL